ncbi:MAG: protein kinase [Thermoanaerobaculia bacterium]
MPATSVSRATTVGMSAATRARRGKALLLPQQLITSPETLTRYRIDSLLGQGGFGQAYLAKRMTPSRTVPSVVAIKASEQMDGWLREAYFGQLLAGHPRAIRVYDTFPLVRDDGTVLYCLALELAKHGDLRSFLQRTPKGWPEKTARREIAGILEVLGKLHRGQLLHRDLTPMNVFVCDGVCLKLGDFGIVRHQSDRRGIDARTLNPWGVPSDFLSAAAPKWQARDDVYQVGQLLGMLVKGTAAARVRTGEVRRLRCTDQLKEIVYRCIGERRKRYESARELIDALTHPPAPLKVGRLRTLKGAHLAFTGILSTRRNEAAKAARKAGATVHSAPSAKTTVVVRGRPNPLQAAGRDAGRKLLEIKRLREKGYRITLLNETQFWRLAGRRAK